MPLIVKEVSIKVNMQEKGGASKGATPEKGSANNQKGGSPELISVCVEQVLEILKERKEP